MVCGRPDGRLSALTSLEATVCLSVNQASSIQSLGSTCESVTIGHNPYKLPLSFRGIFLNSHRPNFLCETMLNVPDRPVTDNSVFSKNLVMQGVERDLKIRKSLGRRLSSRISSRRNSRRSSTRKHSEDLDDVPADQPQAGRRSRRMELNADSINAAGSRRSPRHSIKAVGSSMKSGIKQVSRTSTRLNIRNAFRDKATIDDMVCDRSQHDFSSHSLLGQYTDMKKGPVHGKDDDLGLTRMSGKARVGDEGKHTVQGVLADMMKEKAGIAKLRQLFDEIDTDGSGTIDEEEFLVAMKKSDPTMSVADIRKIFREADTDKSGEFSFDEFLALAKTPQADLMNTLQQKDRNRAGLSTIMPSEESYFGEEFRKNAPSSVEIFNLARSQHFVMELYEARIASLQRFVAMTVMFHQLGKRVQDFFHKMSFGLLGYRMDRTHSIMRIATTASPVSGADVRERMEILRIARTIDHAIGTISRAWSTYMEKEMYEALNQSRATLGTVSSNRGQGSSRNRLNLSENSLPVGSHDGSNRSLGSHRQPLNE